MFAGGVVLIGGTSHTGKSTAARALAAELGWRSVSTDQLARHPGRPWTAAPARRAEVREHFLRHPVGELTDLQLAHYRRMWPLVANRVADELRAAGPGGLVLEGSGVWPDLAAGLLSDRVAAVWLAVPGAVLRARIQAGSGCSELTGPEREAVRKFAGRTVAYQDRMLAAVDRLGLARLDAGATDPAALTTRIRSLTGR